MSDTYFISDLHLSEDNPEITEIFYKFLQILKPKDSLYILGDFFDFWVHHQTEPPSKFQNDIIQQLQQKIKQQNINLYFMPGNRDFLIHPSTITNIGGHYLANKPTLITIHNKNFIIAHGDQWCTSDISYQRYSKIVNLKIIQKFFFALPKFIRDHIASKIRKKSTQKQKHHSKQNLKPIDVCPQAILKSISKTNKNSNLTHYVIHGHTHRLGLHYHQDTIRLVLGDWHQFGSFVKVTPQSEPSLYNF